MSKKNTLVVVFIALLSLGSTASATDKAGSSEPIEGADDIVFSTPFMPDDEYAEESLQNKIFDDLEIKEESFLESLDGTYNELKEYINYNDTEIEKDVR